MAEVPLPTPEGSRLPLPLDWLFIEVPTHPSSIFPHLLLSIHVTQAISVPDLDLVRLCSSLTIKPVLRAVLYPEAETLSARLDLNKMNSSELSVFKSLISHICFGIINRFQVCSETQFAEPGDYAEALPADSKDAALETIPEAEIPGHGEATGYVMLFLLGLESLGSPLVASIPTGTSCIV